MLTDKQFRIARLWSNREMKKLGPLFAGDVVNVSAWDDRDKEGRHYKDYFSKASGYYYTNYTGIRGYQQQKNEYLVDLTKNLLAFYPFMYPRNVQRKRVGRDLRSREQAQKSSGLSVICCIA